MKDHLDSYLQNMKGVVLLVGWNVRYGHPTKTLTEMKPTYLNTGPIHLLVAQDVDDRLDEINSRVLERNAGFIRDNSGLVLEDVLSCEIKIVQYRPIGRAYRQLPHYLVAKHAIINIKNNDNRGFGYGLLSALLSKENLVHPERPVLNTDKFVQFNLHDIQYPVSLNDIPALEEKLGLAINVFSFFDDEGMARDPLYF